jgi:hypothetical protein
MSSGGPLAALLLLAGGGALAGPAADFGPWSRHPAHPALAAVPPANRSPAAERPTRRSPPAGSASPFGLAFEVWSRLLTTIDGPRCAHRPTCSAYARRALARHGLPLGLWLAMGRLLRGAHSSPHRRLPLVPGPGGPYLLDRLQDAACWRPGYDSWSGWKK